jgi:dTDP-4-dehydrorhamnose 3,5-epimerase
MDIHPTPLSGLVHLTPPRHGDARGWFSETYVQARWQAAGVDAVFVQDNHAVSAPAGTVRGLHWQIGTDAQAKLVRVTRGAIFDVAVDIRRGSPTFGRWYGVELSAENGSQLYVPVGFAHGYCTLQADTEVLYKVSAGYAPKAEGGILWNDPGVAVEWPAVADAATLSPKDRILPVLADVSDLF